MQTAESMADRLFTSLTYYFPVPVRQLLQSQILHWANPQCMRGVLPAPILSALAMGRFCFA
ncbi:MAG: hypothetical protein KGJ07_02740 [Patescibacteria group bacterium]|nr:hypothetical protein [Patescibacteria group bacterium]